MDGSGEEDASRTPTAGCSSEEAQELGLDPYRGGGGGGCDGGEGRESRLVAETTQGCMQAIATGNDKRQKQDNAKPTSVQHIFPPEQRSLCRLIWSEVI